MFTIKLYTDDDFHQIIETADSFTVLREQNGEAEITLHRRSLSGDCRFDIKPRFEIGTDEAGPPRFQKAIIENAAGKTTEMISLPFPPRPMSSAGAPPSR